MKLQSLLAVPALLVPSVYAIFADDAYRIDYHIPLLGLPKPDTTFFQQPNALSKASLIYTLSEKGILGAVNPKDGEIVWRQALDANATNGFLRAGEGQDTVVSGVGKEAAAWSAADGKLVWSTSFPEGAIVDLEILEFEDGAVVNGAKDVLILAGDSTPIVRRLDGATGAVKWEFEDNSGDKPFQVLASATNIYYISTHATMLGGLKLKITTIDSVDGRKLDQYLLSSENDFSSTNNILFVGANSAAPIVAWTDKDRKNVKFNIVGDQKMSSFSIELEDGEEVTDITIHAPQRTNSVTRFLVHYQSTKNTWAVMHHIDMKRKIVAGVHKLSKLAGKGTFAVSQIDANLFFTRITEKEVIVVSSNYEILGRWPIEDFKVSGALLESDSAYPVHAAAEVVVRDGTASAVRATVLLSTGDWVLIRNGEVSWTKPEALSGATAAVWAELPEPQGLAEQLEAESHSNIVSAYVHRVVRHIQDLENFPAWLQALPKRITQGFLGAPEGEDEVDQKDTFGFNKRIIVATENGRLIALESGKAGQIVWSSLVAEPAPGSKWEAPQLTFDPERQVILVRVKGNDQELAVDVATGKPWGLQPIRLPGDPAHPESTSIYLHIDGELRGFLPLQSTEPIWRFRPANGEKILSVTARPAQDPIASIGKVLGDRRVLYKYLNPNLVLVSAATPDAAAGSSVSFYLLDSVSGKLLFSQTHVGVDTAGPIAAVISENWLAYSYSTVGPEAASTAAGTLEAHGYQLVVAELFESSIPNDRGPLGSSANYSSLHSSEEIKPYVQSQTYQVPEEISSMAVTHTRQGITSRQLLITLPKSNSIVGIPRGIIDPRRPVGRDPTPDEAAEGLMRYVPTIEFDPKWFLNHKREVFGIKSVITTPALLESTSLVFAFGVDVFGTRVTPSFSFDMLGKNFNKLQMLATVVALFVGVIVVAPLVKRNMINARWQSV